MWRNIAKYNNIAGAEDQIPIYGLARLKHIKRVLFLRFC